MTPYLFFNGSCEQAIDFYKAKLGAEVEMLMRFADAPAEGRPPLPPGAETKVMHAALKIGSASLMMSDGMCHGEKPSFSGFSLSLEIADRAEADKTFAALADGGKVEIPMAETFFSPGFGIVIDRFGVSWMVVMPGSV